MTTDNTDQEVRESSARIEELPASDFQLAGEEQDKPSPLHAAPQVPDDPEDARRDAPPPGDPEDIRAPSPGDPEDDEGDPED